MLILFSSFFFISHSDFFVTILSRFQYRNVLFFYSFFLSYKRFLLKFQEAAKQRNRLANCLNTYAGGNHFTNREQQRIFPNFLQRSRVDLNSGLIKKLHNHAIRENFIKTGARPHSISLT